MSENINQEILAELRKIRTISRRLFYMIVVLIILGVLPSFFYGLSQSSSQAHSWEQVTTLMRREDFSKALSVAQALVARQPNYSYGQAYLGAIYLAMNDVTNAEVHYSRAYELFSNEENEKNLTAVQKRLAPVHDFKLQSK
jgi:cytochrome c-type biogenesis protein CcmH/NrfG